MKLDLSIHPLWRLGFRPFFFFGALFALVIVPIWVLQFSGKLPMHHSFPPGIAHAHEMVYGFASAIIAGFVLTAIQNWTGRRGIHGKKLVFLFLLWLLGRIAFQFPSLPVMWVALFDSAFYPVLWFALLPYFRAEGLRTEAWAFSSLFLMFFTGNALFYLDVLGLGFNLGFPRGQAASGVHLGLNTILVLIVFIGGRVIPFFTESSIAKRQPRVLPLLETASMLSIVVFALLDILNPGSRVYAVSALLAAGIHFFRLMRWQVKRVRRVPLLWVLHVGYLWLVIGLLMSAAVVFTGMPRVLATHAFSLGCMSVIIYGMIVRVSQGHTGRPLHPSCWSVMGFISLNFAALLRAFFPAFLPGMTLIFVEISAILWAFAFMGFVVQYGPILFRPRVDGRDG